MQNSKSRNIRIRQFIPFDALKCLKNQPDKKKTTNKSIKVNSDKKIK